MKRKNVKRVTALAMTTAMVFSLLPATAFAAGTDTGTGSTDSDVEDTVDTGTGETAVPDAGDYADQIDNSTLDAAYLDYSAGIEAGIYSWFASEDGSYYYLASVGEDGEPATVESGTKTVSIGLYTSAVITNLEYQTMIVYVPADYLTVDEEGNVIGIDSEAEINGYTADTAPIIYENNNGAWKSGTTKSCNTSYIAEGMIYVSAASRSRDAEDEEGNPTGKSPTQVVDLKAGVIQLRANQDVIPGDTDRIVSVGTSGAGQMSSILGASGNMSEYYSYMYETGVLGVEKSADGTYTSVYDDSVFGAQCYCPIADIENADLAYAWMRYDSTVDADGNFTATAGRYTFTAFQLALQEDLAYAFVDYINSLGLEDADGNALTLEGPREGTYYDAVLQNMSDALNALVAEDGIDPATAYEDSADWLVQNEDGTWSVTDMAGFLEGTGLTRNKDIPGFDTLDKSAENDAFGTEAGGVHYSDSVAQVLKDNYDEYAALMTDEEKSQVDEYIEEGLDEDIIAQADLMNATEIMLGSNGLEAVDPAEHWRTRNGTADQHTSFTIAYNLCLAAESAGLDADYSLVWNMGHGSNEGTSTGTFIEWVEEIAPAEAASSEGPVTVSIDAATYLDYSAGVE
ncbi:MAG: hypothetical protein LUE14_06930, partial [Clostridiales bacterium]|nr:hypothetical protein [Clostridiales bacterium]